MEQSEKVEAHQGHVGGALNSFGGVRCVFQVPTCGRGNGKI